MLSRLRVPAPNHRIHPWGADKPQEECGVFGIFDNQDSALHTALGLHALQHRGQEATGIVSYNGEDFHAHRAVGLVGDVFSQPALMGRLKGRAAIGHNRYATTGEPMLRNVQPLYADLGFGGLAVAHNGNLTNALSLRRALTDNGSIFQSTTDTEVIIHLMATCRGDAVDRLVRALRMLQGGYALVALTRDQLIGARDPHGIRPLVLGYLDRSYILASETCALDIIGAEYVRDIAPGEVISIGTDGLNSLYPFPPTSPRPCMFEYIYFARPDSMMGGKGVYEARVRIGRELARECPVATDIVCPVPDSGTPAAIGYAEESGLPFDLGIIRNHYMGRTFIEPSSEIRHLGVRLKHNANRGALAGKRVVLVDDSIVRGTTSVKIVQMVREAGAREVHMRVASPPIKYPDYYGIDTPSRQELLAANYTMEEMGRHIGVDSLDFISLSGLYRALGETSRNDSCPQYTDHYFTGDYPVPLTDLGQGEQPTQLPSSKTRNECQTRASKREYCPGHWRLPRHWHGGGCGSGRSGCPCRSGGTNPGWFGGSRRYGGECWRQCHPCADGCNRFCRH